MGNGESDIGIRTEDVAVFGRKLALEGFFLE